MKRDSFTATPDVSPVDFVEMFPKIPALVSFRTRCGKPSCRCRLGDLHGPYWQLRWREGATQRRRYVQPTDVARVQALIDARRATRQRLRVELALAQYLLRRQHWAGTADVDALLLLLRDTPRPAPDSSLAAAVLAIVEPDTARLDARLVVEQTQIDAQLGRGAR
jgi:hypothetical protein